VLGSCFIAEKVVNSSLKFGKKAIGGRAILDLMAKN